MAEQEAENQHCERCRHDDMLAFVSVGDREAEERPDGCRECDDRGVEQAVS